MENSKVGIPEQPVGITALAAEEIRKIMTTKNIPADHGLRVGVRGGGCGVQLILGFDTQKKTDLVYEHSGIMVMMDKKHMMYLLGKQVDFYEGVDRRGFHFVDSL